MVGGVGVVNDIILKISVISSLFGMSEIYKGGGRRGMVDSISVTLISSPFFFKIGSLWPTVAGP